MNDREVELALRKQRLLIESADLRQAIKNDVSGLGPLFQAGDAVVVGVRWLRQHAGLVAGVSALLLVARPRRLWRWTRRGLSAWRAWRKLKAWSAG